MVTQPRIFSTLDPTQIYNAPTYRLAAKNDWHRARQFLDGTFPQTLPPSLKYEPYTLTRRTKWMSFETAPFVVIDTEYQYNPDEPHPWDRITQLDLIGLYGPGTPVLQLHWAALTTYEQQDVSAWLHYLVSRQIIVFQNTSADKIPLEKFCGVKETTYRETHDTMYAHSVLWTEMPHNLEFLASIYGRQEKLKHLSQSDPDKYNAGDLVETANAWLSLSKELEQDKRSKHIYAEFMLPLRPIIQETEKRGLRVNKEMVQEITQEMVIRTDWATAVGQAYAGYPINLNSTDQMLAYLKTLEKSKLKSLKADSLVKERNKYLIVDPKEQLSVDYLNERIDDGGHPLLEARAAYMQSSKQLTAYLNPLYDERGLLRDRVYPHFLPTAQDNARWSTTSPPLAQLPEHLRKLFCPDPGWPWVSFDWDSIELRILAAMARDEMLLEGFQRKWDLHTIHCCEFFNYDFPPDLCDPHRTDVCRDWRIRYQWQGKEDRRRVFAKSAVYRMIYGGDPNTAPSMPNAAKLGLEPNELIHAARRWLSQHRALDEFWRNTRELVITKGEVRSFLGRRRRLLEHDMDRKIRQAYDQPCQAGTSDIFNYTVIEIQKQFPESRFVYGMHDSLKIAVPFHLLSEYAPGIKNLAQSTWTINGTEMTFTGTFELIFAPEDAHHHQTYKHLVE